VPTEVLQLPALLARPSPLLPNYHHHHHVPTHPYTYPLLSLLDPRSGIAHFRPRGLEIIITNVIIIIIGDATNAAMGVFGLLRRWSTFSADKPLSIVEEDFCIFFFAKGFERQQGLLSGDQAEARPAGESQAQVPDEQDEDRWVSAGEI
jgi:hypothetical protein